MHPFNIGKEDKDMIKRKIDRYLADVYQKGTETAYQIRH